MVLIETSKEKKPLESELGSRDDSHLRNFLDFGWRSQEKLDLMYAEDGYVRRNMRIGLSLIDLARPYLFV